jgi:hypothetical protein
VSLKISNIQNTARASCKRQDKLRENQAVEIAKALINGEIETGRGLYTILDMQLHELNEQFNEISSELLLCIDCLNSINSFQFFDNDMLIKLTSFYPSEFENINIATLDYQLDTYILDVQLDNRFHDVRNLNELSKKIVETKKMVSTHMSICFSN